MRVKSAVRLYEKERHLQRVKSRSGTQVETRRNEVEAEIKNKEDRHHRLKQEMQKQKSEEDFLRKSLTNIRQSAVIKNN